MKKNKYKFNIFVLFLVVIIIIYIFIIFPQLFNKKIKNSNYPKKNLEIIISRFNETLKWTTIEPFNKYKYIVYNKGDNEDYEQLNVIKSYKIKNEGKCDHTYLYHIYKNYYNLVDIIVFLPGCIDENYFKLSKAKILINLIEKYNEAFFIIDYKSEKTILEDWYYFKLDDYSSMTKNNLIKNQNIEFRKSKIRPFGKWYEENFHYEIKNVSLFGIMSINKKDIYNNDREYYKIFADSLKGSINDELSHYFEKSWEAIFFPLKNTYLLNYSNSISDSLLNLAKFHSKIYKYNASYNLNMPPFISSMLWNVTYFINSCTYIKYSISKNQ